MYPALAWPKEEKRKKRKKKNALLRLLFYLFFPLLVRPSLKWIKAGYFSAAGHLSLDQWDTKHPFISVCQSVCLHFLVIRSFFPSHRQQSALTMLPVMRQSVLDERTRSSKKSLGSKSSCESKRNSAFASIPSLSFSLLKGNGEFRLCSRHSAEASAPAKSWDIWSLRGLLFFPPRLTLSVHPHEINTRRYPRYRLGRWLFFCNSAELVITIWNNIGLAR